MESGITPDQIEDPEMANAWHQIREQYAVLRPLISIVSRTLYATKRSPEA